MQIMILGKAVHFRPNQKNVSACGIIGPDYSAYDARDCNCLQCIKTKEYQVYLNGKDKGRVTPG